MTSSNALEVITKGSYDTYDSVSETASKPSTSHSTRPDSQLSLEYLPPEAPYYTAQDHTLLHSENEAQFETSNQLYERIRALTDQVHSELDTMLDIDTISSHQTTPGPNEEEDTRSYSDIFTTEGTLSAAEGSPSATSARELVPVLTDSEGDDRDCESASPEPVMDPKIKRAVEKMKRLDEKLADIEKKEKEVKRQRKLLEQQNDDELHTSSTYSLDRQKYPPVFKTQLNDNTSTASIATNKSTKSHKPAKKNQVDPDPEQMDDTKAKPKTQPETTSTNFIQRNIELASDAGAVVAMTEAEKERLDELLGEDDLDPNVNLAGGDDNKLSLHVRDVDEGFSLKQEVLERMRAIDSQLQAILPPSDWESLSCSSLTNTHTPPLSTPGEETIETTDVPEDLLDKRRHVVPGEEVLHQFQMSRTETERLKAIDDRLRSIHSENTLTLPLVSPELQDLLTEHGYIANSISHSQQQPEENTEHMHF